MPYAEVNGQRIHYEDTGGPGEVLVFSHGLLMDGAMFAPQVEAFRDRYRCITWDERGHGGTGDAQEDFTYYDSAEDLYQLVRHLGIEKAVFVGMSQGGYLTLRMALKHPEVVRGLVLLSTQAAAESSVDCEHYDQLVAAWTATNAGDEVLNGVADIILDPSYPNTAEWTAKWKTISPSNLATLIKTLNGRDDITDRLPEITAPSLVIWAPDDPAISRENAHALAAGLPDARIVTVEGRHGVNITHPDNVTLPMEGFLARLA